LAAVLRERVLDLHAECGTNARERIDHEGDQRPIGQTGMCRDIDAIDERAGCVRGTCAEGRTVMFHLLSAAQVQAYSVTRSRSDAVGHAP
jgi:hypothetical protein